MSSQWAILQQQQQAMLQQAMQQQMMALNPLQFQSAVAEMEKALDTPSNVMIYKQHWDYYSRTPGLLDKLKAEQPVQHHLLQHFRQNFWHLVDNLEKVKREAVEQQQQQQQQQQSQQQQQQPSVAEADYLRPGSGVGGYSATSDTFGAQFGADESSIQAVEQQQQQSQQQQQ